MAVARQKHLQQKEVLTLRRWSDLAPNASSGWNSVRLALRLVAKCSIFCRGTNTWWNPILWNPEKLHVSSFQTSSARFCILNFGFPFRCLAVGDEESPGNRWAACLRADRSLTRLWYHFVEALAKQNSIINCYSCISKKKINCCSELTMLYCAGSVNTFWFM